VVLIIYRRQKQNLNSTLFKVTTVVVHKTVRKKHLHKLFLTFINIITFVLYVNIGNFFSVSHPNMKGEGYGRSVSFLQIHMPELTQHALYDCTNK
jgi:hypothetical protein